MWVGRWWDVVMYIFFPVLFTVLMGSYFFDMAANVDDPWNPANPHGISIILLFWVIVATLFLAVNKYLIARPLYRNIPENADCDISTLPGGDDELIVEVGEVAPGWEHLTSSDVLEAEAI